MQYINIITNYDDLASLRNYLALNSIDSKLYRGEEDKKYRLLPKLTRNIKDVKILKNIEKEIYSNFFQDIDNQKQTHVFQELSLANSFAFGRDWKLLFQAQHLGIPTRLLDWTLSIEIAVFFACCNEKHHDKDGQLWVCLVPEDKIIVKPKDYMNQPVFETERQMFINPFFQGLISKQPTGERRNSIQHGKFYFQSIEKAIIPLEKQDIFEGRLFRFIIKKESKLNILKALAKDDFNNDNLFVKKEDVIDKIIERIISKYRI